MLRVGRHHEWRPLSVAVWIFSGSVLATHNWSLAHSELISWLDHGLLRCAHHLFSKNAVVVVLLLTHWMVFLSGILPLPVLLIDFVPGILTGGPLVRGQLLFRLFHTALLHALTANEEAYHDRDYTQAQRTALDLVTASTPTSIVARAAVGASARVATTTRATATTPA